MPDKQRFQAVLDNPSGYRMTAFGQYEDDDSASTLKQRDHKDATDLVVAPSFGMIGGSGQEGATVEEQPAITASHGQPGNVAQAFNWQSGGDARGLDLTDETSALTCQQTPAVMLHVRGGVDRDRHGKLAGKGPLLSYELSATLDATQPWTLFEPRSFDEMNFTTDADAHHVLRAGTKQSTGVMVPQAFRKSARAQSSEDAESLVEDGQANPLNVFDVGDTRTTHAIVEPTLTAHETGQGWWNQADYAGTLRAEGENRPSRPSNVMVQQYGVRRLTPVECERLQSFPDGWTEPAGSDSARYKAMGNAVTVNVVRWILGRLP